MKQCVPLAPVTLQNVATAEVTGDKNKTVSKPSVSGEPSAAEKVMFINFSPPLQLETPPVGANSTELKATN